MKPIQRNRYLILNYAFVCCVLLLVANDHFFKPTFANAFTGKLSDMVGIILLPLLLLYLFPLLKNKVLWISAVLFTLWKLPLSDPFIVVYNTFAPIPITRVVDYTDLAVLLLLPIPWYLIHHIERLDRLKIHRIPTLLVVLPTLMGLVATAPTASSYYKTRGGLFCGHGNLTVPYNQDEIVALLQEDHINFDSIIPADTSSTYFKRLPKLKNQQLHFYHIATLVLGKDTIHDLNFAMRTLKNKKTRIYINQLFFPPKTKEKEITVKMQDYYKELVYQHLKKQLNP